METSATIQRLVGVYDASGSVLGELSYFIRARVGLAHCALCEVTHGRVRERADWRSCRDGLPVPFATYHRDDQPEAVRTASGRRAPVVVAELDDDSVVVLLGPDELERCGGEPERLVGAIERAVADAGLAWGG